LVGRILKESPELVYVYEPFNVNQASGICKSPFPVWFTYVCDRNADRYKPGLDRTMALKYNLLGQIVGMRRPKDLVRLPIDFWWFLTGRLKGARPIIKDPIAVFSAEWLAKTYHMDVVTLIRHPAGFVSSRKSRGDEYNFATFLRQDELMEDHLELYRDEIQQRADDPGTIVQQSALLWKLIYHCVAGYQRRHADWLYLRLEDLSAEPVEMFGRIFEHVGADFTERIGQVVGEFTSPDNPKQARGIGRLKGRTLKRSSKASAKSWKKKLSEEEIQTVRSITEPVAENWYSDQDW
jgi:hypothetical protein